PRRLVERVAHQLEERRGEGRVAAHHGSMARRTRLEAEARLKAGEVPVVVATASLELGIDVGAVDLVCHVGAPRALATLIQRVGRSGHTRGGVPKGVVFPLTRDDLVQAAAAVRAVRAGELDTLRVPENPLDILAQQCVATVATGDLQVEELWALVGRAYPFRRLERADFDAVLDMLADGVATRRGRRGALLHLDRVHGRVRGRRRARPPAVAARLPDTSWLVDACGLSADAAAQLGAYVGATEAAVGTVPTTGCVVAERFFEEAGGMQLVVHAPFGGRINRAWGLALRKRFC